ncbi:MAG: methyl-accepting chemotaxis protein [Lachnospiraceae bacterium]|nr:methyl-accepting chemotaxis protein [Lachnospiraceae bacterium]
MKKKSFNMNLMLLLFSMIPLIVTIVGMTIMAVVLCTNNLENKVEDQLEVAARGLKFYTEYELKNGTATEITYDSEYIDILKADDVDLTVFVGDTRLCTSVLNDNGQRNEGTKAADGIWAQVSKGEKFINDNTKVAGKDYYVVYLPITDASNKVIGMAFAGTPRADISSARTSIILVSVITAVILFIIFGAAVIILSKKVSTPLKVTADSLETIAKGDLTAENDLESAIAETDSLIQSYRGLQANISKMLGSISGDANDLATRVNEVAQLAEQSNSSTEQINSAIAELADGATSMAQNVQNINEQVMEMGGLINNVVESVEMLSSSSSAMQTANNEAYGYITNLEKSSSTTKDAVAGIKSQVVNTNEAITRITSAVGMITDIASQTNLLALNASIEAARAGEMGKGFAVVAESIGNLANQSAESTAEIRAIIDELTKQSEQSVLASESVEEAINEEQVILGETKKRFDVLNTEITNSVEDIRGISAQTESLESIKATIVENVSDLSAISQENAASTEEVTASMENIAMNIRVISENSEGMNGIAGNLVNSVGEFKF